MRGLSGGDAAELTTWTWEDARSCYMEDTGGAEVCVCGDAGTGRTLWPGECLSGIQAPGPGSAVQQEEAQVGRGRCTCSMCCVLHAACQAHAPGVPNRRGIRGCAACRQLHCMPGQQHTACNPPTGQPGVAAPEDASAMF